MSHDSTASRLFLYRQYCRDYGPLTSSGSYLLKQRVAFADGRAKGVITWKYDDPSRGLVYVLEDSSGFPFLLTAEQILRPD